MTPQEQKAIELINRFKSEWFIVRVGNQQAIAKQCALIALEFAKNNYAIEDDCEEIESIKNEIIKL